MKEEDKLQLSADQVDDKIGFDRKKPDVVKMMNVCVHGLYTNELKVC